MKFRKKNHYLFAFYMISIFVVMGIFYSNFSFADKALEERDFEKLKTADERLTTTIYIAWPYFIVTMLLNYAFIRWNDVKSITTVLDFSESLVKGNLDAKIPKNVKKRDDEFGELARGFDRVVVSLKLSSKQ